ncbi:hypothetical protein KUCAC02_016095 [Xyrichtys novacula]|uniref:Apolipoprotein M n=1 Tax=Xyrichtys novacula TaxID=13765 RepID=A0AAV1EYE3_XYRNO|nr:hypothetical protein KUCAC02_016095 [Xyrichtys novacula]
MLLATCVVALFCFIPASSLAPPNCEDLVRPLDHVDGHQLDGRWAMIAGSLVDPKHVERFKSRDSAVIKFSNASDTSNTSNLLLERMFGFGDKCEYHPSNITLEGNGFSSSNVSITFIHTGCSDCLLMRFTEAGALRNLYLFSKRREVEGDVMDEFKTQAECVKSQPPVMMDSSKKLCPDQMPTLPEIEELAEKLKAVENVAPDA